MEQILNATERRPWTLRMVVVCVLVGLSGGIALAVVGLVAGALYGGNYATDFVFNDLRGYEATGQIGLILGFVLGSSLCTWLACLHFGRRR